MDNSNMLIDNDRLNSTNQNISDLLAAEKQAAEFFNQNKNDSKSPLKKINQNIDTITEEE